MTSIDDARDLVMEDMNSRSTDELMVIWATSDDVGERIAASKIVRKRAADFIELSQHLREFGEANPEYMQQL